MTKEAELKAIGRYEIVAKIGEGGMATVYKGIQPSLNRPVAIKVLPKTFSSDKEMVDRFLRESQAIAALSHPNIIQIIDRGEDKGTYYFVMEYMDGPSLEECLKKGRLPLLESLDIISEVCRALEYAHDKGVIHRDVKPSNILLSANRKVAKVADFGIAHLDIPGTVTLTRDNKSLGTLNYMSPEQRFDAGSVDQHTDIYSVGVILYQMLTGALPLGSFRLPSHFDRRIPPQIDRVILKCLRSNPEDRYSTARELMQDINAERAKLIHLQGEVKDFFSAVGRWFQALPRRVFKERKPAYIAGGLTVLAAAVGLVWFFSQRSIREPAIHQIKQASPPGNIRKRFEYAETLSSSGLADRAIAELEKIIADHPASSLADDARIRIGQIKEGTGRADEALADYMGVLSLYPESDRASEAAFLIATNYMEAQQDETKAVQALRNVRANYPTSPYAPRALLLLAKIQKETGRGFLEDIFGADRKSSYQMAAGSLEKLLQDYPRSKEAESALMELALLYDPDHLNRPETSNRYYQRLAKEYPATSRSFYYQMARNHEALGEEETAREFYRKFLETNPTGKEARLARKKAGENR